MSSWERRHGACALGSLPPCPLCSHPSSGVERSTAKVTVRAPLQARLVGKGCSFYVSIDSAVVSQVRRVVIAPSFSAPPPWTWAKRGLPS